MNRLTLFAFVVSSSMVFGQDYEVADISCTFGESTVDDQLRAKLRKPEGFQGAPIFADDRKLDPATSQDCQIRPDPTDPTGHMYDLLVRDLSKCGVVVRNGFANVRIWFPRLPGVVMMSDQEVIIMCKPAESVVTEKKAAGFAGKLPPAARVSGIVEESPGNLEYEVALFREVNDVDNELKTDSDNEVPVEAAVPIGTKLQLRASINSQSAWKYIKLLEVTVSSDAKDAYAEGHIKLIKDGCRVEEFYTILPRQPYRPRGNSAQVRMEFEAVLLDAHRGRANQLWIHARIKACVLPTDCEPEFCLDIYQPQGAGRRRRGVEKFVSASSLARRERDRNFFPVQAEENKKSVTADFGDNVGVTVTLPGEEYFESLDSAEASFSAKSSRKPVEDCQTFLIVGGVLGLLLFAASVAMCALSHRLYKVTHRYKKERLEEVVREHRRKFGIQSAPGSSPFRLQQQQQFGLRRS